jgi:hypothetical protein
MAEKLPEPELRVFRVLINESQFTDFERICVELTHSPALESEDVAAALGRLEERGYAEEFKPGHWRYTPAGYGVRRSLQGLSLAA